MMSKREDFLSAHPEAHYLEGNDLEGTARYLRAQGWIDPDENLITAGKAGEGNMNYTLRVTTSGRSFILKQARPWVEKYSHIAAPWDRALVEGKFYGAVSEVPSLAGKMPRLLGLDPKSRILMLEDLGHAHDLTFLYTGEPIEEQTISSLASYLSDLHRLEVPEPARRDLANRKMRELNHQHIFDIPLRVDNGLDLDLITPGLQEASLALKQNLRYKERVAELGSLYLEDGPQLVHGDYFPGSWLRTADGIRVIDPEFCFCGAPEFDLGVMVAHMILSGQNAGRRASLLESYEPPDGFDTGLALRFAGAEIMRRLLGVAQLPLSSGLERKQEMLELSKRLVLDASMEAS